MMLTRTRFGSYTSPMVHRAQQRPSPPPDTQVISLRLTAHEDVAVTFEDDPAGPVAVLRWRSRPPTTSVVPATWNELRISLDALDVAFNALARAASGEEEAHRASVSPSGLYGTLCALARSDAAPPVIEASDASQGFDDDAWLALDRSVWRDP